MLFHDLIVGPKQKAEKVGIQVGRSEKIDFYKGTFRAQTSTIVHSRNFLIHFRPYLIEKLETRLASTVKIPGRNNTVLSEE